MCRYHLRVNYDITHWKIQKALKTFCLSCTICDLECVHLHQNIKCKIAYVNCNIPLPYLRTGA